MERLRWISVAAVSALFIFATVAQSEMITIFGPVFLSKTTHEDHDKEVSFKFSAPQPGNGLIIVKKMGNADSRKKARHWHVKLELNDRHISSRTDVDKHDAVLGLPVELLKDNELEVKIKSCKDCEVELAVLGERPAPPPPAPPLAPPNPNAPPMP